VQHERVDVQAEGGDHERHLLGHQAADEVHVPRKAIEAGNDYRLNDLARRSKPPKQRPVANKLQAARSSQPACGPVD
jgi:hypothetical protein